MEYLSSIVEPNVAIITSISTSHIGNFGRLQTIAKEKYKIIQYTENKGMCIYPSNIKKKTISPKV